jgi:CHRD domain
VIEPCRQPYPYAPADRFLSRVPNPNEHLPAPKFASDSDREINHEEEAMHLRRGLTPAIVVVISGALVFALVAGALAGSNTVVASAVKAKLTGKDEVPGPGDDDGSGDAALNLKKKKRKISFTISFEGIQNPVAGHIHKGTKKVAGPIKVTLFEDPAGVPSPEVSGTVKAKKKLIKKIKNDPNGWYVNVHTPDFPDGAIRGQLKPGG